MNERPDTSLFAELRRRKVVRAALSYLAGAWVVIEVSETVLPVLGLPAWIFPVIVWVAVLAFPLVVALAWVYRLESGSLKRETWSAGRARVRGGRLSAVLLVGLTGLLAYGAWRVWVGGPPGPSLDDGIVAVLPFHTAGATPELSPLRQGMIDLLRTRLTGEVGPRAVDVRTVMSAWSRVAGSPEAELPQDSALLVSEMTGAATAVLGSVVVSGGTLTVAGDVIPSNGRGDPVRVEATGPVDSLVMVVDRFAAQLISVHSGRDASEIGSVGRAFLPGWPALQLYLSGEAAYRRGDYGVAFDDFSSALEMDSTFAMAAFGVERSAPWASSTNEHDRERARRLAWRYRDRLSRLDRTHLIARLGPNYPVHPSARDLFEARQEALDLMPDRAEVWYEMGDVYFHWGDVMGETDPLEEASDYFDRTLSMDEGFAAPLQHVMLLAAVRGDLTTLRALAERVTSGPDSASTVGQYARWRVAKADPDPATLDRFWSRPDSLSDDAVYIMVGDVLHNGLPLEHIHREVRRRAGLPGTRSERIQRLQLAYNMALAAGRPAEAARALDELGALLGDTDVSDRLAIMDALYADGDSARAAAGVSALADREAPDTVTGLLNRCAVAQWRLWHGEGVDDPLALATELRSAAGAGTGIPGSLLAVCAELVDALATPAGPRRVAALDRLDSLMLEGPLTALIEMEHPYYANLALARLREADGDLEGALRAARRMPYYHGNIPQASFFLARARLASRLGLREEAIAAYGRFVTLRADAEPSRQAKVERARETLRRLGENTTSERESSQ